MYDCILALPSIRNLTITSELTNSQTGGFEVNVSRGHASSHHGQRFGGRRLNAARSVVAPSLPLDDSCQM